MAGLKILGGGELKHGLTIEADQRQRIGTRENREGRRHRDLAAKRQASLADGKRFEQKKQETAEARNGGQSES